MPFIMHYRELSGDQVAIPMLHYLSKFGDSNLEVWKERTKGGSVEDLMVKEKFKYSVYERFSSEVVHKIIASQTVHQTKVAE